MSTSTTKQSRALVYDKLEKGASAMDSDLVHMPQKELTALKDMYMKKFDKWLAVRRKQSAVNKAH